MSPPLPVPGAADKLALGSLALVTHQVAGSSCAQWRSSRLVQAGILLRCREPQRGSVTSPTSARRLLPAGAGRVPAARVDVGRPAGAG
jgi:hypothetical protein